VLTGTGKAGNVANVKVLPVTNVASFQLDIGIGNWQH
jgi:hypothetical protein